MAPLPIGFAVFMVHLATIPVTGTGINPARSFGAAVIYNQDKTWDDHVWIFISKINFDSNFHFVMLCLKVYVNFFFFFLLQWIFWVGPLIGAAIAAFYYQFVLRASAVKAFGSFRSSSAIWFWQVMVEEECIIASLRG